MSRGGPARRAAVRAAGRPLPQRRGAPAVPGARGHRPDRHPQRPGPEAGSFRGRLRDRRGPRRAGSRRRGVLRGAGEALTRPGPRHRRCAAALPRRAGVRGGTALPRPGCTDSAGPPCRLRPAAGRRPGQHTGHRRRRDRTRRGALAVDGQRGRARQLQPDRPDSPVHGRAADDATDGGSRRPGHRQPQWRVGAPQRRTTRVPVPARRGATARRGAGRQPPRGRPAPRPPRRAGQRAAPAAHPDGPDPARGPRRGARVARAVGPSAAGHPGHRPRSRGPTSTHRPAALPGRHAFPWPGRRAGHRAHPDQRRGDTGPAVRRRGGRRRQVDARREGAARARGAGGLRPGVVRLPRLRQGTQRPAGPQRPPAAAVPAAAAAVRERRRRRAVRRRRGELRRHRPGPRRRAPGPARRPRRRRDPRHAVPQPRPAAPAAAGPGRRTPGAGAGHLRGGAGEGPGRGAGPGRAAARPPGTAAGCPDRHLGPRRPALADCLRTTRRRSDSAISTPWRPMPSSSTWGCETRSCGR